MEGFRDTENHQWQFVANPTSWQNPNSSQRYPIEDAFSRMNLNNIQTTRTRSANLPTRFLDYNDLVTNLLQQPQQPRSSGPFDVNSSWSNSTPSMYNQPILYPLVAAPPPRVYRARDHRWTSLLELKGFVCMVARDQNGCRLIQKRLDHDRVTLEEIDMVFVEVMQDDLHELMVHQSANYLVQKLFSAANQQQRTQILRFLVQRHQRFYQVCTNINGSRTIQKLMERITTSEQRDIFLSVLERFVVLLTNNGNGHHIIQQCLYKFPSDDITHIMNVIVDHCFVIATNKNGCCMLQQCLEHADNHVRARLLAQIIANAHLLSEDEFGNYVVQFVLGMRSPFITTHLIRQLEGSFVTLSFNKYGSHVVQKCLEQSGEQLSSRIIVEIMNDPDDFLKVIGHSYGNYVIQSALLVAKGDVCHALHALIRDNVRLLQSSPFGKKVLSRAKGRKDIV